MRNVRIVLILGLLALTMLGCAGSTTGNGIFPANGTYGPATSVPQVYMTPSGDRLGHYAPYYYPDGGTSERP